MNAARASRGQKMFLGIEGGGTRTVALAVDEAGRVARRKIFGRGNVRLLDDAGLKDLFQRIRGSMPAPSGMGFGLAGARDEADCARVRRLAEKVWGKAPLAVTNDLEIALEACGCPADAARVLVLSGTGSCCYGKGRGGKEAKIGGWGHLLGDKGSGHDIAITALRQAVFHFDREGKWTALGENLLRDLQLNTPGELIGWMQQANKAEVAALAPAVFSAAKRDPVARGILAPAAELLARDAVRCAARIEKKKRPVIFFLAGGVLLGQASFARSVGRRIQHLWPRAEISFLEREGAWGAVKMAREAAQAANFQKSNSRAGASSARVKAEKSTREIYVPGFQPEQSPTEQSNPRSTNFSELTVHGMVELMIAEEAGVAQALRREARLIERASRLASDALRRGGRIFYAGAGTSGRLGVLDASECPPTFRSEPEMVQGIIAGGQRALWQAVEGAEDDAEAGAAAVKFRGAREGDFFLGIAASGRTPFVWGALGEAKKRGAATALLCFNPALKIARARRPDLVIAVNVGPEILTGSTRLKCGTATKLILNTLSTIAMARLGKVAGNLMVDLNPSNVKLRDRAVRIVRQLAGCDEASACAALESTGWGVREAWQKAKKEEKRKRGGRSLTKDD